jgi:hypothetical protein
MTTQSTTRSGASDLARTVLRGNALFSGVSGAALVLGARPIAGFLGWNAPLALAATGVVLIGYAAYLFWATAQEQLDRRIVLAAAVLDIGWVIGSAVLLLGSLLPLTTAGKWAIALIAEVVAIFAALQLYALRRK